MAWQPRHSDIADAHARHLAAWFFVTMRHWSGTELTQVSSSDAEGCCPSDWLAAMPAQPPPSVGMVAPDSSPAQRRSARRRLQAALPDYPPPTWLRGPDGRLYPARRRQLVGLVERLVEEFPTASSKAIARLVGCSHTTVAEHRRRMAQEPVW